MHIEDGDGLPTKLRVIESRPKEGIYPLILNFQNGTAKDSISKSKCMLLKNRKNKRKAVAIEVEDLVYAGEECTEDLGHTILMARNRYTGEIRLIEVGNVDIAPVFSSGNVYSTEKTTELELSKKFGSKKSKKRMEQKEKLKISSDTVKKQIEKVISSTPAEKLDLNEYITAESPDFYIPPVDREADEVHKVYDVYKILSEEQYEAIYKELQEHDYEEELSNSMKTLCKKGKLLPHQTVLAMFLSALIRFYNASSKDMNAKGYTLVKSSATLNNHILTTFAQKNNQNKMVRSYAYKDKAYAYGLVLGMLLQDYCINLDELGKEYKIGTVTMISKSRVTGATLERVKGQRMLRLKIPLQFGTPKSLKRLTI